MEIFNCEKITFSGFCIIRTYSGEIAGAVNVYPSEDDRYIYDLYYGEMLKLYDTLHIEPKFLRYADDYENNMIQIWVRHCGSKQ